MKKIILFVFLANTISVWAQNGIVHEKPDWWNSGKNVTKDDTTQVATINSINNSFSLDSVYWDHIKSCCFLLKQDYSLYDKRKKKFYGYNDQGKFGTSYSVGIKCKGFNIITDEAVRPWNYDSKYQNYKGNKLTPVVTSSKYSLLSESIPINFMSLDSIVSARTAIKDGYLYTSNPLTSAQEGLVINDSDTCKTGALLWIYKDGGNYDDNTVKIGFVTTYITVDMVGNADIIAPDKSKEFLSCLFITQEEGKHDRGQHTIYLTGIGSQKEGKWRLSFPFKGFKPYQESKSSKCEESGRLTEIKQFD